MGGDICQGQRTVLVSLGENGCYLCARVSFLKPTSISLSCRFPLSNRRACFISVSVCVLLPFSFQTETTKEHQAFNFLIFPEQFFVLFVCFCFLSSGFPFLTCHSQLTVPRHRYSQLVPELDAQRDLNSPGMP